MSAWLAVLNTLVIYQRHVKVISEKRLIALLYKEHVIALHLRNFISVRVEVM